jgi:hypothetical protein
MESKPISKYLKSQAVNHEEPISPFLVRAWRSKSGSAGSFIRHRHTHRVRQVAPRVILVADPIEVRNLGPGWRLIGIEVNVMARRKLNSRRSFETGQEFLIGSDS